MPQPPLMPLIDSSSVDAYLDVKTKRAGKVKGESMATGHIDDIIVKGWHWGVSASSALASDKYERRSYSVLTIHKLIDRATTSLMAALAFNDEVKEAKLTLRRAGGAQEIYFIIKLEKARVVSQRHETDSDGHPRETVAFAFRKIEVQYTPQASSGLGGGTTSFVDEIELS